MIPLALWDEDLVEDQLRGLADAIMSTPKSSSFTDRMGSGWGKPDLAAVDVTKVHLGDYVTGDSRMFFKTMKLSTDFLSKPVREWKDDTCYKNVAAILKSFKVTNEGTEHGVKLVADFLGLAKKLEVLQTYLQVVEQHRKDTPNLRQLKRQRLNSS